MRPEDCHLGQRVKLSAARGRVWVVTAVYARDAEIVGVDGSSWCQVPIASLEPAHVAEEQPLPVESVLPVQPPSRLWCRVAFVAVMAFLAVTAWSAFEIWRGAIVMDRIGGAVSLMFGGAGIATTALMVIREAAKRE